MTATILIRCVGISHLLQVPFTFFLASKRGVNLRATLTPRTRLATEVLHNMAFASICLPTLLGMLIAYYPADVQHPGAARSLAAVVSTFWCWRLYRQVIVLRSFWPTSGGLRSLLNPILILIFAVQGPGLALLLICC